MTFDELKITTGNFRLNLWPSKRYIKVNYNCNTKTTHIHPSYGSWHLEIKNDSSGENSYLTHTEDKINESNHERIVEIIAEKLYRSVYEEFLNIPGFSASLNIPYKSIDELDKKKYKLASRYALESLISTPPTYFEQILSTIDDHWHLTKEDIQSTLWEKIYG